MTNPTRPRRGLRLADVCRKTGAKETQIKEAVKRGDFPAPFKIMPGGKSIIWDESEIDAHLERQMAARDAEQSAPEPKPTKRNRRAEAGVT